MAEKDTQPAWLQDLIMGTNRGIMDLIYALPSPTADNPLGLESTKSAQQAPSVTVDLRAIDEARNNMARMLAPVELINPADPRSKGPIDIETTGIMNALMMHQARNNEQAARQAERQATLQYIFDDQDNLTKNLQQYSESIFGPKATDNYAGSLNQAYDIAAAKMDFDFNNSGSDASGGGFWGAEGNWGGYGDWDSDAY